jgi:hypothetical protein
MRVARRTGTGALDGSTIDTVGAMPARGTVTT